jgi:hypothetical protein
MRAPVSLQERCPSVAAALASRRDAGRHASGPAGARPGTRDDSMAVRRRGWLLFPLVTEAVRGSRMAGKAKGSSSTASRKGWACRCPRAPRPRPATGGLRLSRCWIPCTSARADGAGGANASRYWQRIRAMMPKTSADTSVHEGFAPRSLNASGKAANRGDGRLNKTSHATKPSGRLPGPNASTAGRLSAGNVWPRGLMRFSPLR